MKWLTLVHILGFNSVKGCFWEGGWVASECLGFFTVWRTFHLGWMSLEPTLCRFRNDCPAISASGSGYKYTIHLMAYFPLFICSCPWILVVYLQRKMKLLTRYKISTTTRVDKTTLYWRLGHFKLIPSSPLWTNGTQRARGILLARRRRTPGCNASAALEAEAQYHL